MPDASPDFLNGERLTRVTWGLLAFVAVSLMLVPLTGHLDDSDDQLYRVVSRHLVQDHAWLSLRYLPNVHPRFREHLPFGFWPERLALSLGNERLAPLPGLFFSCALLALMGWLGTRLAGHSAGLATVGVLALTETLFTFAGTARLDAPLLLFAWAGAVPFLLPRPARGHWLLAALSVTAAVCIKGPFGLVPLFAAMAVRVPGVRSPRPAVQALLLAFLALLPTTLFLLFQRDHGDASWWSGYVHGQLLTSATGARADGASRPWLYPFAVVGNRFWPGLPLLALGGWAALRGPERIRTVARRALLLSAVTLLVLCLPGRKVWNHTLIAFPPLALSCGVGLAALAERLGWTARAGRRLAGVAALAGLVLGLGLILRAGSLLWKPRCIAQGPLAAHWRALPAGTRLGVVTPTPAWGVLSSLAAEQGLSPWLFASPAEALSAQPPMDALLVRGTEPPLSGWALAGSSGEWMLLRRQ